MPVGEWRHNADLAQWELGEWLDDYQEFRTYGHVTDEAVARADTRILCERVKLRFGSLPPPLKEKADEYAAADAAARAAAKLVGGPKRRKRRASGGTPGSSRS